MRTALILVAIVAWPIFANAESSRQQGRPDQSRHQGIIACTQAGCVPVPPGCFRVAGRTSEGSPSGFDKIVCLPDGQRPFR
jgi:hypothetical protein